MGLKIIITGTTGMVGEGVLLQCLQRPEVEKVLAISRKPNGHNHPKMEELIHPDFTDLSDVEEQLSGYDACFFCAGISSVGVSEEAYEHITYDLTLVFAQALAKLNTHMTFIYVSGQGTNAKSNTNWRKIKGKTENDLKLLPFKQVFAYRPGIMKPMAKNSLHVLSSYKYVGWMYPLFRAVYPNGANTLTEVGDSMVNVSLNGFDKFILNGKEITETANKT